MKPKPADKNDPKVRAHDILMGVQEKKDNGRVKLVMSLASLAIAIDTLPILSADRVILWAYFCNILAEIQLTARETNLLHFEIANS